MKVFTVVGARPQFIKSAPVSKALVRAGHSEYLLHTGQHYDDQMSAIFFRELDLREPDLNLEVGSGSHGAQTAEMLAGIEQALIKQKPDCVLVYGDTNSTLAGALAAAKLRIPVAHVEAGLRSFNREMPEEHNRVLTDHCADLLFCPTATAVTNLRNEGITGGVNLVGDTMYDAVLQFSGVARQRSTVLERFGLEPKQYALATVHRPYNTDVPANLAGLVNAFRHLDQIDALTDFDGPVVFPVHPRTRDQIAKLNGALVAGGLNGNLRMVEPLGYLDTLTLERNAKLILTDSGGMQKEAYFFGVPCVTLRPETEWVETVEAGWNVLAGCGGEKLKEAGRRLNGVLKPSGSSAHSGNMRSRPPLFGDGHAAEKITALLETHRH
jgi:UDP-N-acetylglucosamine 2-epimerase